MKRVFVVSIAVTILWVIVCLFWFNPKQVFAEDKLVLINKINQLYVMERETKDVYVVLYYEAASKLYNIEGHISEVGSDYVCTTRGNNTFDCVKFNNMVSLSYQIGRK